MATDTSKLQNAVKYYQQRLGRALSDAEMDHLINLYTKEEGETNMSEDKDQRARNILEFEKRLDRDTEEREKQDKFDRDFFKGLARGRTVNDSRRDD